MPIKNNLGIFSPTYVGDGLSAIYPTYFGGRLPNITVYGKDKSRYRPTTIIGRGAQAFGVSDKTVKKLDIGSAIAQQVPYLGKVLTAMDLGMHLNDVYHKVPGSTDDSILDALNLISRFKYKIPLKKGGPNSQQLKEIVRYSNYGRNGIKGLDFINDVAPAVYSYGGNIKFRKRG